ncbi:MAG: lytic murein transglycosylase [Alphaproteobacteria bacterium]
MTLRILTSLIFVSALSLPACASAPSAGNAAASAQTHKAPTLTQSQRFEAWKADFIKRAIGRGYDAAMVRSIMASATINELALERDSDQPEFTKPIWSYVDNAANATRISGGKAKLAENADVFTAVEERYFVDRYILTAIWGLESAYGQIMGNHDIVSALSTFAFEGRRQAFGERELFGIFDSVKSGYVRPDQLTGSWASAMGMMQFIPTTYRDYAVDFNNDGNRDIWTSPEDALGSAAHYLSRHGWRWQEPVFAEVELPQGFNYSLSGDAKKTVNEWTALGVRPFGGAQWSPSAGFLEAKLLIPAGHLGPKFLTYKNFDVIKKYNNSTSYAMGINVLAQSLQGYPGVRQLWPKDDAPLSLTDREDLQKRLTALGYDTGGVDGQIGPNSRRAIRAWQQANGVPADGYVEQRLFKRIMGR